MLLRHPAYNPVTGNTDLPSQDAPLSPRVLPPDGGTAAHRRLAWGALFAAAVATLTLVQYTSAWSVPLRLGVGIAALALTAVATTLSTGERT